MTLLTALMFATGHTILAMLSGFVLTAMTAMALALFGLAWSTMNDRREGEVTDMAGHPG